MRLSIQLILLAFFVISGLLALPSILKDRDFKTYTDKELRQRALNRGMMSIPKTYKDLLKVVDNPNNPMSPEKIALGKELYFETALSVDNNISCATCHIIKKDTHNKHKTLLSDITSKERTNNCISCHLEEQSGTDRLSTAVGDNGKQNPQHLNTLTILNSSLAKFLTWSGDGNSVEERAGVAITTSFEMNMKAKDVEQRLQNNPKYIEKFKQVFKEDTHPISFENTKKAIGAYVRTLLTRGPYDNFLDGEDDAISAKAKRGLTHFINLGCKGCHTGMSVGGQNMQKFPIRHFATIHDLRPNFKLYPEIKRVNIDFPFENKGGFQGQKITNKFRVPILRNVTKTSPYFHNGSVAKIHEAVAIMGKHQLGINLSPTQIDEIVAFLKTLEGDIVDYSVSYK